MPPELDPHTEAAIAAIRPKAKEPIDNSHDVAMRQGRMDLADALRLAGIADAMGAYNRLLPALWLDAATGKPRLRIRHVNGPETYVPLQEGIRSLLADDGPDQRYVREVVHAPPPPPTPEERAKEEAERRRLELQFAWSGTSPLTRELLKLADVAIAEHKPLLLALARVFAIKPEDFINTAGEPAKCAAAFFGLERK